MPRSEGPPLTDRARRTGREPEPQPDSVIIGVTTSPRRQHYLKSFTANTNYQVMFVTGPDPELNHQSMIEIARHKAEFVLDAQNPNNQIGVFTGGPSSFVLAADVRTRPLVLRPSSTGQRLVPDREPETISLGKPRNLEEIRSNLGLMARVRKAGKEAYYEVEAGTALRGRGSFDAASDSVTAIFDRDLIRYLATPRGFVQYVEAFYRFYSAEAYAQNIGSKSQPAIPDITAVAGGLSAGTFLSLGAVLSINGIEKDTPGFEHAVRNMLQTALHGFNEGVLKKIRPDIKKFNLTYPLLQIATELALTPRKI